MRRGTVLLLCLLAACGGSTTDLPSDECNPLGTNACMTPWPSSAFQDADGHLAIPEGTLPSNAEGIPIDPAGWNRADGFSPSAPVIVSFPGGVSPDNLVDSAHFADSLGDGSPTVIVDMDTGERIAHFAEVDLGAAATPDHQALYLRPAARLTGGHHYAVALKKTLRAADGSELERPAGFQHLLDGTSPDHKHPLLERMRPGFPAVLAALGIPEDQLLLAWDFTVATDEFTTHDATVATQAAIAALEQTPPTFEVFGDDPIDDGSVIAHKITGEFDAPLFLTNDGKFNVATVLARDANGDPALQGMYRANFTAIIPACAYTAQAPVGIMVYGHGLMGSADQVASGAVRTTAAELCLVTVGTDMRGMSERDIGSVASTLTNLSNADSVFDVLVQGLVNHVALTYIATHAMADQLFTGLVDTSKVYYYGLSQGGIFGTSVVYYDPAISRGVTGVGAGNYSLMLERSTDWGTYHTILSGAYADPLDITLLLNLCQMRWDHSEAAGVANQVTADNQILLQIALGDEQVPNIASEWEARTMGIPVLTPSPDEPYGLTPMDGPLDGSALVIEDGGAPAVPLGNIPADDTGMHDLTRNQPASRRQIGEFFATGQIVNECDGACYCPDHCQ